MLDITCANFHDKKENQHSDFEKLLDKFEIKNIEGFFMNCSGTKEPEQTDSFGIKSNKTC